MSGLTLLVLFVDMSVSGDTSHYLQVSGLKSAVSVRSVTIAQTNQSLMERWQQMSRAQGMVFALRKERAKVKELQIALEKSASRILELEQQIQEMTA